MSMYEIRLPGRLGGGRYPMTPGGYVRAWRAVYQRVPNVVIITFQLPGARRRMTEMLCGR